MKRGLPACKLGGRREKAQAWRPTECYGANGETAAQSGCLTLAFAHRAKELVMAWYYYLAHFFAGAFLANGVPHFVQGICGNKFQTPFASPRGIGVSSAIVNVMWGFVNFVIGGVLLRIFFPALPPPPADSIATALGFIVMALWLANHFGKVRNSAPHR
jgi:hypothetical protein